MFIGATCYDKKFRAFDKETGKLLWEASLPAAGNATTAWRALLSASALGAAQKQRAVTRNVDATSARHPTAFILR